MDKSATLLENIGMRSQPLRPRSALDSRALARGAVGDLVDVRSKEGRFLKQAEAELLAQLGGNAPFAQRALIRRAARLMLATEMFEGHIVGAEVLTPSDATALGGLSGALLDVFRELGLSSLANKQTFA